MEIQGSEILLSLSDLGDAVTGADTVPEPEFEPYVRTLYWRAIGLVSDVAYDQSEPMNDNLGIIAVPYSKRVIDCLHAAIKVGRERTTDVHFDRQTILLEAAIDRQKYAEQARQRERADRERRKQNFRVIK